MATCYFNFEDSGLVDTNSPDYLVDCVKNLLELLEFPWETFRNSARSGVRIKSVGEAGPVFKFLTVQHFAILVHTICCNFKALCTFTRSISQFSHNHRLFPYTILTDLYLRGSGSVFFERL